MQQKQREIEEYVTDGSNFKGRALLLHVVARSRTGERAD